MVDTTTVLPTVRIIASEGAPTSRCKKVNILTSVPASHANRFKQYVQATGAALMHEFPEFVVVLSGAFPLAANGLTTIFIPGYSGPA